MNTRRAMTSFGEASTSPAGDPLQRHLAGPKAASASSSRCDLPAPNSLPAVVTPVTRPAGTPHRAPAPNPHAHHDPLAKLSPSTSNRVPGHRETPRGDCPNPQPLDHPLATVRVRSLSASAKASNLFPNDLEESR